ncbi:MAG TPA: hypothetical protein VFD32_16135 [Dehalococcoidia bacterium]|nr:hypothetical protein [Dehalococcoidia bacterium]
MADEATRPEDGGSVQGYLLRTESGDLYTIPLAELERFRLSAEQSAALQAAPSEAGEAQGYGLITSPLAGMTFGSFQEDAQMIMNAHIVGATPVPSSTPTVVPVYSTAYGNPLSGRGHGTYSNGGATG